MQYNLLLPKVHVVVIKLYILTNMYLCYYKEVWKLSARSTTMNLVPISEAWRFLATNTVHVGATVLYTIHTCTYTYIHTYIHTQKP